MDELAKAIAEQALQIDPGFKLAPKPPAGEPLLKSGAIEEKRFVLGVAHPAGMSDLIKTGLDGHRDWMSADTVEKAAWGHLTDGRQIGLRHRDGTTGAATVVESYIYRGPDWTVTDTRGSTQIIKSGDWVLGAVLDEPTWAQYKAGEFTGWSVQGSGTRRPSIAKSLEPPHAESLMITVTSPRGQNLLAFARFCKTIEYCGSVGTTRTLQIDIDGDGAGQLRFAMSSLEDVDIPNDQLDSGDGTIRLPGIGN